MQLHTSRVKVLAAPPDVSQLVELPIQTWQSILTQLTEMAAYVVVDTAAVTDAVLSEVLTHADDIVVVTGPDLASLRSAVVLLQTLDGESNVHGRTHVVLNRSGVRGGIPEDACAKQVGEEIAAALPDDASLAVFALNRGVPYVLSHPRSILSRKVQELVSKVFHVKTASKVAQKEGRRFFAFSKTPERTVQEALAQ